MSNVSQISTTFTTCYSSGELRLIEVQVLLRTGIPKFDIIGLPQNMIREGRDRILSALSCLGIELPAQRVLVSLNPGDISKEGSHFDLPILVGLLRTLGILKSFDQKDFYWGEVSLTGSLQPLPDLLAHLLYADHLQGKVLVSAPRETPIQFIYPHLGAEHYPIYHIKDLLTFFDRPKTQIEKLNIEGLHRRWIENTPENSTWDQLKGSEEQFLLFALIMLGRHNLLLQGTPGCGKTTWCRATQLLQTPMCYSQWRDRFRLQPKASEQIFSIEDLESAPFESPHHSSSRTSLVGGGSGQIVAGAMSRAHGGLLFLDEFLEFSRDCLESLREPLETKSITIARKGMMHTLDADIQLLAAMNPCRCGSLGSQYLCHCRPAQFHQYQQKLSGPLKDRFHAMVWWNFKNQMRPEHFSLKYIRKKILTSPQVSDIDLSNISFQDERNARLQRNQTDLFISWCRWFEITKPKRSNQMQFKKFFELMEINHETDRKHRTAI